MANRRKNQASDATARVRNLIVLDAANVMKRLVEREAEMVALFSRLRDREPMLSTLHSWFTSVGFGELALLEPGEQHLVNAFHELLGEVRWYCQYTEDMPNTVQLTLSQLLRRLEAVHAQLVTGLGKPLRSAAVVDAEVVVRSEPPSTPALPARSGKRNRTGSK